MRKKAHHQQRKLQRKQTETVTRTRQLRPRKGQTQAKKLQDEIRPRKTKPLGEIRARKRTWRRGKAGPTNPWLASAPKRLLHARKKSGRPACSPRAVSM